MLKVSTKKKIGVIIITVTAFICITALLNNKDTNKLSIRAKVSNNSKNVVENFQIVLRTKSEEEKDIVIFDEKSMDEDVTKTQEATIETDSLYFIRVQCNGNVKSIYYSPPYDVQEIMVDLDIDSYAPLSISGKVNDGKNEYDIKEIEVLESKTS